MIVAVTAATTADRRSPSERSCSKLRTGEPQAAQHAVVVGLQIAEARERLTEKEQRHARDHETEQTQCRRLYVETPLYGRTDLDLVARHHLGIRSPPDELAVERGNAAGSVAQSDRENVGRVEMCARVPR